MEGVSKTSIAQEAGVIEKDALRFGLQSVRSEIIGAHPLQSTFQSVAEKEATMKQVVLASTYGSAFPMKMDFDLEILSRFQRPGALPSSMLGYEGLTGSLDDIDFDDFNCLNGPGESETYRPADLHHTMEVRRGLSKGPVHPTFI